MILHMRPQRVPAEAIRFTRTFGLGGIALVLFGLLLLTGVLMMFTYEPGPGRAWQSIVSLERDTLFGGLIRGVHYWSANLLIPVTVLHLLRVFLTGGYRGPRRKNWFVGLGILCFVLLSGFTGYLLPWDQTAYWAITICSEMLGQVPVVGPAVQGVMLGGSEIGSATLINFYALHVVVAPLTMVGLLTWHFWYVRTADGVILPRGAAHAGGSVEFDPDLLLRETVFTAVVVAVVLVLAFGFGAPLGEPANPGISPNPAKAPWYFLGVQELLIHFDALFAVVVIPLCVAAGLVALPYLEHEASQSGHWFLSPQGRRMAIVAALIALVAVPLLIVVDDRLVGPDGWLPGTPPIISNGLVPFLALVVAVALIRTLFNRVNKPTRSETRQALFVFFFVAFVILTATAAWFRGEGMSLVWPWQI